MESTDNKKPIELGGKSPIIIQITTLFAILVAIFHAGYYARHFIDEQKKATSVIQNISQELKKMNQEKWSYPMQRDFSTAIKDLNPSLMVPSVSEIREKYHSIP